MTSRPGAAQLLLARAIGVVLAVAGVLAMHVFSVGHMPAVPAVAHHVAAASGSPVVAMAGMAEVAAAEVSHAGCLAGTCLHPAGPAGHDGHGAMAVCVPLLLGAVLLLALLAAARAHRSGDRAVRSALSVSRRMERAPPQRRMSLSLSELSLLRV